MPRLVADAQENLLRTISTEGFIVPINVFIDGFTHEINDVQVYPAIVNPSYCIVYVFVVEPSGRATVYEHHVKYSSKSHDGHLYEDDEGNSFRIEIKVKSARVSRYDRTLLIPSNNGDIALHANLDGEVSILTPEHHFVHLRDDVLVQKEEYWPTVFRHVILENTRGGHSCTFG